MSLGYCVRIVFSLCPFPDESADVHQIWCQSVQPFWICDPLPLNDPGGIDGRLGFSLCPFPVESADVNQSWCQSVWPFDSFHRLLNVWPLNPPSSAPCVWTGNLFGYIHSHMDLQMCAKFDANWSSRLTTQDFWNWYTLTPPQMPPGVLRGDLYLAYVHSQMNPHTCSKSWCQSVEPFDSFPDILICDPLKPPKMPRGVFWGDLYLAYVQSQMYPPTP